MLVITYNSFCLYFATLSSNVLLSSLILKFTNNIKLLICMYSIGYLKVLMNC